MRVAPHDLTKMRYVNIPVPPEHRVENTAYETAKIDLSQIPDISKIMITISRITDGEGAKYYLSFADKQPWNFHVYTDKKRPPADILKFYNFTGFIIDDSIEKNDWVGPLDIKMAQTLVSSIIDSHNRMISDVPYKHIDLDQLPFSTHTEWYESCPLLFLLDGCKLSIFKRLDTDLLAFALTDLMAEEDTAASVFDRAFPHRAGELLAIDDTVVGIGNAYGHVDAATAQSFIDFVTQETTDRHNERAQSDDPHNTYPAEYRTQAPTANGTPRVIHVQFGGPPPAME